MKSYRGESVRVIVARKEESLLGAAPVRLIVTGRGLAIWLCALAVLVAGCSVSSLAVPLSIRYAPGGLGPEDSLTVVLTTIPDHTVPFSRSLETRVTACIQDALTRSHHTVRMVPPDPFRPLAAPDWDGSPENLSAGDLEPLTAQGVRYLITVTVRGGRRDERMGVKGLGPAGIAVWSAWEHWSTMRASVIDVRHARMLGIARADASDTSFVGLWMLIFPFVGLSSPEPSVCRTLGEDVAEIITNTNPVEPSPSPPSPPSSDPRWRD